MSEAILHKVGLHIYISTIHKYIQKGLVICLFFRYAALRPYFAFGHRIALQDFWCHSSWKKVYKEHHQKEERGERLGCVNGGYSVVLGWF